MLEYTERTRREKTGNETQIKSIQDISSRNAIQISNCNMVVICKGDDIRLNNSTETGAQSDLSDRREDSCIYSVSFHFQVGWRHQESCITKWTITKLHFLEVCLKQENH